MADYCIETGIELKKCRHVPDAAVYHMETINFGFLTENCGGSEPKWCCDFIYNQAVKRKKVHRLKVSLPRRRESRIALWNSSPVCTSWPASGTLYIGVSSDLRKRIWEHKNNLVEGFTRKYGVHRLVHYEIHGDMAPAFAGGEAAQEMAPWLETSPH